MAGMHRGSRTDELACAKTKESCVNLFGFFLFCFVCFFFSFALCDLIVRVSFEHVKKSSAEAEFHRCCIIIVGWAVSNRVVPTRNLHFSSNNQTLWVCWSGRDKQIFSCTLRR